MNFIKTFFGPVAYLTCGLIGLIVGEAKIGIGVGILFWGGWLLYKYINSSGKSTS